jgi:hypothetical protein
VASFPSICYDDPNVPAKFQKQWTTYGRWFKTTLFYWEQQPAKYISHVMRRVDRDGGLTCDERLSIVIKLAKKYSGRPLASIKPYEHFFCKCNLNHCNRPAYVSDKEKKKAKDSSKEAIELARKNNVPHCVLPQYRKEYPVCWICNVTFVKNKYECCGNRSCKLLRRMESRGLLDRKKENLNYAFRENNMSEFVEICYLTAVVERFIARKRPQHLNQFFKRYKGFENVTKPN